MNFLYYYDAVEAELQKIYGITINDINEQLVENGYENNTSIEDLVDEIGRKYDLDRFDSSYFL